MTMKRRDFLAGTAILVLSTMKSRATVISGGLPWTPNAGSPPVPIRPGPWHYFTSDEGRAIEALADRIIPPDPQTPGGKDTGCAVFIDRQLAGPYGRAEGHYTRPPFMPGTKQQGPQSADGPAATYRKALAALDRYCRSTYQGKLFPDLSDEQKDELLKDIEDGKTKLEGVDGQSFFDASHQGHAGGFLRRSALWWQPRHGRLENDRLSRRALQLSRLGRTPQRTLSAAAREHHRAPDWSPKT